MKIYIIEATFYKNHEFDDIIFHEDLFVSIDKSKALEYFEKLKSKKISTLYKSNYVIDLMEYTDNTECCNDDPTTWNVIGNIVEKDINYNPSDTGYIYFK